MDTCDVIIVGGGPAGSSCAWALRGSGLDVLVVDRAAFPRNKLCAGWITPLILDELEFHAGRLSSGRLVIQPITGFRLGAIGGPQVEIRGDQIVSYGIRRCEFDEFLLRRSGARLREGIALTSLERYARRLAHQRRNPCPDAGGSRRPLLSRWPLSRQQGIAGTCAGAGNRVRDGCPSGCAFGCRRRTTRALLLPRHEGLRMGLPQGQLPQCGTRPHRLARDFASREGLRRLSARDPRGRNSQPRHRRSRVRPVGPHRAQVPR